MIDVLSGASAGGLNAALLSPALISGARFDALKKLWLEPADIQRLLRDPGDPKPVSVLKGDDYLLVQHREQLDGFIAEARQNSQSYSPPSQLDLWLAVTLTEPAEVVVYEDWAGRDAEASQRAVFHFATTAAPSDFPGAGLHDAGSSHRGIAARLALLILVPGRWALIQRSAPTTRSGTSPQTPGQLTAGAISGLRSPTVHQLPATLTPPHLLGSRTTQAGSWSLPSSPCVTWRASAVGSAVPLAVVAPAEPGMGSCWQ